MGENQAFLNLRKEERSIQGTAQTLATDNTTIWNVLKKKKTTGVLSIAPKQVSLSPSVPIKAEILNCSTQTSSVYSKNK